MNFWRKLSHNDLSDLFEISVQTLMSNNFHFFYLCRWGSRENRFFFHHWMRFNGICFFIMLLLINAIDKYKKGKWFVIQVDFLLHVYLLDTKVFTSIFYTILEKFVCFWSFSFSTDAYAIYELLKNLKWVPPWLCRNKNESTFKDLFSLTWYRTR